MPTAWTVGTVFASALRAPSEGLSRSRLICCIHPRFGDDGTTETFTVALVRVTNASSVKSSSTR